jgi:preprotein translocase subunit SecA
MMVNRKNIENNLNAHRKTLAKIREHLNLAVDDSQIKRMTQQLKIRASSGESLNRLLPEAYALVFAAVKQALGFTPYDSQLLAAIAMADGQVIELATGEGKTLAAVFTAFLTSLPGKGVHVFTVNDYLARRDALWMKPVYGLLGVTVEYITEHSAQHERKQAYQADITYVTAKEAGFDYLRGFLCYDEKELLQRSRYFAIIDEADSILIDEARIPLVISGDCTEQLQLDHQIFKVVEQMEKGAHFNTDEYDSNIYLEEAGISLLEKSLGISELYSECNMSIVEKAEAALQALYLLKRDVDYIVKDEQICIVDQFTGRVAKNRQWANVLQSAVERKEGVASENKGTIMNSITLQNYLMLYSGFCGMTGTARTSAVEFLKFYHTNVTVIPPNKPCIRMDYPDFIFTTKDVKYRAVAAEVRMVHQTGRPILIGTCSVEESEQLANLLKADIKQLNVLNAKNDEEEAAIIAGAGMLGAVTISTNMAGRGVDIRLGGETGEHYETICALGGLYVIGTSKYESVRIDNQLRGRAGRQGDPGESRFLISLEDDLIVRYGLRDAIPKKLLQMQSTKPLAYRELTKAVKRSQTIIEGQIFDAKTTLSKYTRILEDQRLCVYQKRERVLSGEISLSLFQQDHSDRYTELLTKISEQEFQRVNRLVELYVINQCWSNYLLYVDCIMDEITVISQAKEDPLKYYNEKLISGFEHMEQQVHEMISEIFDSLMIRDGQVDLEQMNIKGPTSTKTYLVHDGTELQTFLNGAGMIGAAAFAAPLLLLSLVFDRYRRR